MLVCSVGLHVSNRQVGRLYKPAKYSPTVIFSLDIDDATPWPPYRKQFSLLLPLWFFFKAVNLSIENPCISQISRFCRFLYFTDLSCKKIEVFNHTWVGINLLASKLRPHISFGLSIEPKKLYSPNYVPNFESRLVEPQWTDHSTVFEILHLERMWMVNAVDF